MLARIVLCTSLVLLTALPVSAQTVSLDFFSLRAECDKQRAGLLCTSLVDELRTAYLLYTDSLRLSREAYGRGERGEGDRIGVSALEQLEMYVDLMVYMQWRFPKVWAKARVVYPERS